MGEKTTVEIDDIKALKQHALDTGKTMKQIINEAIAEKIDRERTTTPGSQRKGKERKKDLDAEVASVFKQMRISPDADYAYRALKKKRGIREALTDKDLTQKFIDELTDRIEPILGSQKLGEELKERLKSLKA